jgi:hypothetical protein
MMSADGSRRKKQEGSGRHIGCNSCRYFYITWDKKHPYGCRTMGFISAKLPSIDVLAIEGRDCLSFERKDAELTAGKGSKDNLRKGKGRDKKINVIV